MQNELHSNTELFYYDAVNDTTYTIHVNFNYEFHSGCYTAAWEDCYPDEEFFEYQITNQNQLPPHVLNQLSDQWVETKIKDQFIH